MEVRGVGPAEARSLLDKDRRWTAYALGDLEPPHAERAQLLGALRGEEVQALVLLYSLPRTVALLPFGNVAGLRAIMSAGLPLPERPFVITDARMEAPLAEHYDLRALWPMWRMALTVADLRQSPPCALPIKRLSVEATPSLAQLYSQDEGSVFDAFMLEHGVYFGAWEAERLVAVAGTHVTARGIGAAAVGGVFTEPEYRGRGLATAVTHAVVGALGAEGTDLLVLNVRQDNAPAIAAYRRLGFRTYMPFREGPAAPQSQ